MSKMKTLFLVLMLVSNMVYAGDWCNQEEAKQKLVIAKEGAKVSTECLLKSECERFSAWMVFTKKIYPSMDHMCVIDPNTKLGKQYEPVGETLTSNLLKLKLILMGALVEAEQ